MIGFFDIQRQKQYNIEAAQCQIWQKVWEDCDMSYKEIVEKLRKNWIVSAVVTIMIGLVLVLFPGSTLRAINYVLGGIAIAMGVVRVVRYFRQDHTYPFLFQSDLIVGLLAIGLGLFMLSKSEAVLSLVPFIFGLLLIGCGVGNILRSVDARRAGVPFWGVLLVLAILTAVAGSVILSNPFGALEVCVAVIGACMIYEGATDIVIVSLTGKRIDAWKKAQNTSDV